jgi:alpha-amylase/alpha-mannosidase (GH57 family)
MSADTQLRVVLCWHMHQPMYRDAISHDYLLPWTYLHALKDYVDMAAHLEAEPNARAVVNFAPVLLDQLDDYAHQVRDFLTLNMPIRDPLLATLGATSLPVDEAARRKIVGDCLKVNEKSVISRFPPFMELVSVARHALESPAGGCYLSDQFLFDMITWYHLAWLGETVRRDDPRVGALQDQGRIFTNADRRGLLLLIGELLEGVIPRWRALAESGRVELSVSPYGHPILPLLQDLNSARDAMPDVSLPSYPSYPGGDARARWHISEGISTFKHYFGFAPNGCWPSEGSVSESTLQLLGEYGFRWAATGETVLHNSVPEAKESCLHHPYRYGNPGIHCFFRDDGLSDLIGFKYSDWHADDAANDLVGHLEGIRQACAAEDKKPVVSIILDGENAWEYYPDNAVHFLAALYRELANKDHIQLTTFNACIKDQVEA